jgi:hypothetical protein
MPRTGSGRTRAPARAQNSSSARTSRAVGIEVVAGRVADQNACGTRRRGSQPLGALQPVVGPASGERPRRGVIAVALAELAKAGQQDLLDRDARRSAVPELPPSRRRRARARRSAGRRPGRWCRRSAPRAQRDTAEEIERPSWRASRRAATSPWCVQPVLARGALRLRISEATFPGRAAYSGSH